ncbi:hypothetical protein Belba_0327 [Belliella baltica DSM 15883]|uniref:Uncharacterized protein n=1 Tax=Belliella baltica (strain DSM 15883 / CIP 108006 / LMG 21964 / BA134) TaxID=866536 RepID=I3Z172_BELBD|nr:hypothetical protein [Belliella baltica]AFL82990.1 hypothetical protein Belba_0327 [Belliella baltica DSM 15883]
MKQLTLNISEKKYNTFLEFIKTLDYVKVEDVDEDTLNNLKVSLAEVKLIREGKLPKQTAKDFLNEL